MSGLHVCSMISGFSGQNNEPVFLVSLKLNVVEKQLKIIFFCVLSNLLYFLFAFFILDDKSDMFSLDEPYLHTKMVLGRLERLIWWILDC